MPATVRLLLPTQPRPARSALASSDRWADDAMLSRDLIDLAVMAPPLPLLRQAMAKASTACGAGGGADLARAVESLRQRPHRLDRCMRCRWTG